MRCIKCHSWSMTTFCDDHKELVTNDRFEATIVSYPNFAEDLGREIARTVWTDEQKFPTDLEVESILAENERLDKTVLSYFLAKGYGNWVKCVDESVQEHLKTTIEVEGSHSFKVHLRYGQMQTQMKRNGWRELRNLSPIRQDGYSLSFNSYDQVKVGHVVLKYWPLTEWPEIKYRERVWGDMIPVGDGETWTSHLAINNGQIVGGAWITNEYGKPVRFSKTFDDAAHRNEHMGRFGLKHVAPSTDANLRILIDRCQQPFNTMCEAENLLKESDKNSNLIAQSFQWRLKTKKYDEDGLHMYGYE